MRVRFSQCAPMPPVSDALLQELRMRYNASYAAYQACVRAVSEVTMSGTFASATLLEQEANARGALSKARAALMAAMVGANGGSGPAP
jgi:hypothetical protein